MAEFHPQDCSLKPFHPVVESTQDVAIFAFLPPIPQPANLFRIVWIIGCDGSAFAVCAQIFRRIKAETADISDASRWPPFILCSVRLGCIFDHDQVVSARDLKNWIHIGGLPIQMHGQNHLRSRRNRRLDRRGIHRERAWIDVHQYRSRARVQHGSNAGYKREWNRDNFVAWADSRGQQREMQCARTRIEPDALGGAAIRGELLLEIRNFMSEDELAALENTANRGIDFGLDAAILRLQIKIWYLDRRSCHSKSCMESEPQAHKRHRSEASATTIRTIQQTRIQRQIYRFPARYIIGIRIAQPAN